MAKCPECNKEIEHLVANEILTTGFTVECGAAYYSSSLLELSATPPPDTDEFFSCPECGKRLFDSEGEAVYFFVESKEDDG